MSGILQRNWHNQNDVFLFSTSRHWLLYIIEGILVVNACEVATLRPVMLTRIAEDELQLKFLVPAYNMDFVMFRSKYC